MLRHAHTGCTYEGSCNTNVLYTYTAHTHIYIYPNIYIYNIVKSPYGSQYNRYIKVLVPAQNVLDQVTSVRGIGRAASNSSVSTLASCLPLKLAPVSDCAGS